MCADGTALLLCPQHRAQPWLRNSAAVSSLTRQPAHQTLPTLSGASEILRVSEQKQWKTIEMVHFLVPRFLASTLSEIPDVIKRAY